MPLTKLQSHVLRLLAAERSPDSYIAGGVAINREGPRFSGDIDIFQDTEQRLEAAAKADAKTLTDAGLELSWKKIGTGKREAEFQGLGDRMRLEWHDSAFRFSRRNETSFSVMSCIPPTLPRTRHRQRRTAGNRATSSTS